MSKSKIEWTEATWNPIRGCSRVSPGCSNCYAMRMAHRSNRPGGAYEGLTRIGAHGPTWTGDVRFVSELLDYPLRMKKPHRIFVNSMSDLFHERVTDHQIAKIFGVMMATPHHTYQILTKRPQRAVEWFKWIASSKHLTSRELCEELALNDVEACHLQATDRDDWPLPNVWLGVSVEDQKSADERIPLLLQTPAAVRWISAEPLLEHVGLLHFYKEEGQGAYSTWLDYLNWVVVGGESGPGARPMNPSWVRSLRHQCAGADVPFFFKQWGAWAPVEFLNGLQQFDSGHWPESHTRYTFDAQTQLERVGKKTAGHLLDGVEHREYPA